ncbi:methyltransferase [Microbacterium sp. VKM Ac-2870]|uniref:class I SAM-dependent methyltransferase n=1 Tax=Microbacterium sp. VKM Ac-2870 TaxID=2783825 RepID=UPI00188D01AB|nr:methyltransferase [Microbacterium sp. VKM Ac-2870]MBF4563185.1 methyltransferase [Microbacterium sp. VKM Ac-2870]
MSFPFDALRRRPDSEGEDLVAADAADRLILDESATARQAAGDGEIVVIGDTHGALALAAAFHGASDVRVHQDALSGERALALNAAALRLTDRVSSFPLDAQLLRGARVVLLRLPRSLDALRDIAGLIAAHARTDVVVYAGGRLKYMSVAMNTVLGEFFDTVDVTHARQKSRVLVARGPHGGSEPVPASARIADLGGGLEVRAYGGAFAGARLDVGTRALLAAMDATGTPAAGGTVDDPWVDLACGTGIVATWLALRHPTAYVYASDQSAVATASTKATAAANGVAERVHVARADGLEERADASASFIALNPPFHSGAAVTTAVAEGLFIDAGRALRTGGELWCVWNSPLRYRPALERFIGPTRQASRDAKFTVTVSTKR